MPIQILSEDTINKIAAGEVIERPANAVKELVENSIDAGSHSIEIEIKESGIKLIRVTDDGCGIPPQELPLAILRHATSKISGFNDLFNITSLGFRGEALPSIASVSKMELRSHAKDSKVGREIKIAGGKIKAQNDWAGKPGTDIEVTELFYNTPARLKFLKSASTEKHNIISHIEQLALARPDIAFKVISDGKEVLNAPRAKNVLERVYDVLGDELASSLVPFEAVNPVVRLYGFITPTEKSQSNKNSQFLFVNKRPVQFTKAIFRSIYDAYSENLPKGRHPGVLIFMEINPADIDVNIHPTKREIRISKESELYDLFYRSIKTALNKPVSIDRLKQFDVPSTPQARPDFIRETPSAYKPGDDLSKHFVSPFKESTSTFPVSEFEVGPTTGNTFQVFGMYLVAQKGDELLLIDQHAAAERIRYERYLAEFKQNKIQVQKMLLPETIDMPSSRSAVLTGNMQIFNSLGWEIEEFGAKTFRITGVPAVLGTGLEIRNVLNEILESLAEETKLTETEKIEKIIMTACRRSIKAGDKLSPQEMSRLMQDLFLCTAPFTCPHGRPTVFKIAKKDLEKYFGRS